MTMNFPLDTSCVEGVRGGVASGISGLPARTGNVYRPYLSETPRYLTTRPPLGRGIHEPLLDQDPALVSSMRVHDAMRMQRPGSVLNRKVYDSVSCCDPLLDVQLHPGDSGEATFLGQLRRHREARNGGGADDGTAGGSSSSRENETLYASRMDDATDSRSTSDCDSSRRASPTLLRPYYTPRDDADTTLLFESRFEGGNLCRAIQVYEFEYDLVLRPDINTNRHTQWYYFRISNTRAGYSYKLNIINMMKCESLYEQGMKVLAFSEKQYAENGSGWYHTGDRIAYYQNNIRRPNGQYYYTLTFTIDADHDFDNIYVAHSYPYSYTELQYYLNALEEDPERSRYIRRRLLCETLAGNHCDILTITSFDGNTGAPMKQRRGVVITGRVHPGESNASWMMKGLIDFLVGPSLDARRLRDNFIFKIVPMLNPDGVINGNYRCSLARVDLNRIWNDPCKRRHPTVYHAKEMIRRFIAERTVLLYADFHGHSQKKNIFMYGCERRGVSSSVAQQSGSGGGASGAGGGGGGNGSESGGNVPVGIGHGKNGSSSGNGNEFGGVHPAIARRLHERVFPLLLHQNAPTLFSLDDCSFKIQRCKETTARVVVWREFQLCNSFTLEASFAGSSANKRHFTQACLEDMGRALGKTVLQYSGVSDKAEVAVRAAYR